MKLVKIFGGLIIVLVLLFFLLRNTNQVDVDLFFVQYSNVPVAFVMLLSLAVGVFVGFGLALASIFSARAEIRSLRLKNRRLSDELNDLRNVAIDEGIYDIEEGEH
ncbi:MAG: lipopolysaccharide assembly LapA domain-containing protein [Fidelibacterota bacterium]